MADRIAAIVVAGLLCAALATAGEPILCKESGKRCLVKSPRQCRWCTVECPGDVWTTEGSVCPVWTNPEPQGEVRVYRARGEPRDPDEEPPPSVEAGPPREEDRDGPEIHIAPDTRRRLVEVGPAAPRPREPVADRERPVLKMSVDRVFTDSIGWGVAVVSVSNRSRIDARPVEVECTALDRRKRALGVRTRRMPVVHARAVRSIEVSVNLNGAAMSSMDCSVRW